VTLIRRFFALLVLLLSAAGLAACVLGIVYTWRTIGPLTEATEKVFDRVDHTVDLAGRSLDAILTGLREGRANLEELKKRSAGTDEEVRQINQFERLIAQRIVTRITPEPDRVQQGLSEMHDASIILQSLLGQVNELPVGVIANMDPDQVQSIGQELSGVETKSRALNSLLSQVIVSPSGGTNPDEVTRTSAAVDEMIGVSEHYQATLQQVAANVAKVKERTFLGLRVAPYAITGLLLWLAVSQLSLLAHAWSWFKGR
jgi:hypothetical protein